MNQFERNAAIAERWHYIKRKLRAGECLNHTDRQMLITLLEISEMDKIPSSRSIENYQNRYKQLLTTDFEAQSAIKSLAKIVHDFEVKFIDPFRKKTHFKEG